MQTTIRERSEDTFAGRESNSERSCVAAELPSSPKWNWPSILTSANFDSVFLHHVPSIPSLDNPQWMDVQRSRSQIASNRAWLPNFPRHRIVIDLQYTTNCKLQVVSYKIIINSPMGLLFDRGRKKTSPVPRSTILSMATNTTHTGSRKHCSLILRPY